MFGGQVWLYLPFHLLHLHHHVVDIVVVGAVQHVAHLLDFQIHVYVIAMLDLSLSYGLRHRHVNVKRIEGMKEVKDGGEEKEKVEEI
jgi:hypothetical protein